MFVAISRHTRKIKTKKKAEKGQYVVDRGKKCSYNENCFISQKKIEISLYPYSLIFIMCGLGRKILFVNSKISFFQCTQMNLSILINLHGMIQNNLNRET